MRITVYDQPKRSTYDVDEKNATAFIQGIKRIANEQGLEVRDVLKAYEVLEISRSNDLYAANGNYQNVQTRDFATLLRDMNEAIRSITNMR